MKIISKNQETNTTSILIEVDTDVIEPLKDVVREINTKVCDHFGFEYRKNLFTNFDELFVRWGDRIVDEYLDHEIECFIEDKIDEVLEYRWNWIDNGWVFKGEFVFDGIRLFFHKH